MVSIAVVESADRNDKGKGVDSRSSSSQHLMPLRFRTHTERRREKQRENHNKTYFQSTLSGDKVQNRGWAHQ